MTPMLPKKRSHLDCFKRLVFVMVILSGKFSIVSAQNLVPNPNFETYSTCPTTFSQINLAVPWISPTIASPDYYNACTTSNIVDVPNNWGGGGYQPALTGDGYTGCYFYGATNYREYIQVQLTTPMEAGVCYKVGCYINLINQFCGVNQAGIYISVLPPSSVGTNNLPVTPQIQGFGGYYSDTIAWVELTGLYAASGGEQFITIGNFKDNSQTLFDPACTLPNNFSYYYIDSVYVFDDGAVEVLPLDLGPDVVACMDYEIDGESGNNVSYEWSDGSQGHTLVVNSSGVYSLTITEGCARGIDSIEVTFPDFNPVQLNPGFVSICEGEAYTIILDPDAGTYTWNDGTINNEYTITQSGLYTVTLDDGCHTSFDDIVVEVISPPQPISLGNDTILCNGDEFEINLEVDMNSIQWQDGSDEIPYLVSGPGIYSVTISNACGTVSDEMEVYGLQEPEIDLGPDTLVWCDGEIISYDFNPDLGDYLWSDGSFDPFFTISTSGIYGVTLSNACGVDQDNITVYEAAEPIPGLGDTISVCATSFPFALHVQQSSVVDDIIWSTGETSPQILVSIPGAYAVTISNVCYSVSDSVSLDIIPVPVLYLPDSELVCAGDTLLLDATIPSATYLWQDGSTLPTIQVTGPGLFTVAVTTMCGIENDTTTVTTPTISDPPDLGPDFSLCPGEQATLYVDVNGATYLWNDMSTADTLHITSPGMYSVTAQVQCAMASDTVLVTSNTAPPVVDLPSSLSLCQGDNLTIDANVTGVSYLWSDGSTNPVLTISTPGAYSVTVNNSCGTDRDTVMVVDGGTLPVIDLGADVELCPGETHILAPDLSAADLWHWQDGSILSSYVVNAAGTITLEATNVCGTANDTLIAITLPATPILELGNDTSLCSFESLNLTISIPDVSITWFDGSHANQVTIVSAGTYAAAIANTCGTSSDTLIVTSLPDIPSLNLGPDQFLCPGEMFSIDPGIPDVEYLWQDGSTASSYTTTQAIPVILIISNECGTATDTLVITESTQGPLLNLGPDVIACEGDTVIVQSGIAGVTYIWQDGSTDPFFKVSQDAMLTLHISNACGQDDDTLSVSFITPPNPDLGPDTLLCDSEILLLTSNADAETISSWQDGSHGTVFMVSHAGIYTLNHANGCGAKTDSIVIDYQATPPPFSLGPDLVLCPGDSVVLHAPPTTDPLMWQDGSNAPVFTAHLNQIYGLSINNACGSQYDEVQVSFADDMPVVLFDTMTICPGEVLTLDVTQAFVAQYIWSTGAAGPTISVHSSGDYVVTVSTVCYTVSATASVLAEEDCAPDIHFYIPNVFSPDGDQVNDDFQIYLEQGIEVISMQGEIFDRWGDLIFSSKAYPFIWNGNLNSQPMNPGVYVYRMTFSYAEGTNIVTKTIAGNVTLMR